MRALLSAEAGVDVDGTVTNLGALAATGVGASVGGAPGGDFTVDGAGKLAAFSDFFHDGAGLAAVGRSVATGAVSRSFRRAGPDLEASTTGGSARVPVSEGGGVAINGAAVGVAFLRFVDVGGTGLAAVGQRGADFTGTGAGTLTTTLGAFRPFRPATIAFGAVGGDFGELAVLRTGIGVASTGHVVSTTGCATENRVSGDATESVFEAATAGAVAVNGTPRGPFALLAIDGAWLLVATSYIFGVGAEGASELGLGNHTALA